MSEESSDSDGGDIMIVHRPVWRSRGTWFMEWVCGLQLNTSMSYSHLLHVYKCKAIICGLIICMHNYLYYVDLNNFLQELDKRTTQLKNTKKRNVPERRERETGPTSSTQLDDRQGLVKK